MRRTTQSSVRSSNQLQTRSRRHEVAGYVRWCSALVLGSCAFGVAGCDTPRAGGTTSASASAVASQTPSAKPAKSGESDADVAARRERAAAFVTFYETFVRAVADNAEDCDKMGAALEAFTADDQNVKKLSSIDEDAANDPRLATEVDKLTNGIDEKYPGFDEAVKKCGTNAAVRAAMKKIALAP